MNFSAIKCPVISKDRHSSYFIHTKEEHDTIQDINKRMSSYFSYNYYK